MHLIAVFVLLLCGFNANAMVTGCINYDVENTHPDDLRVSLFIKCMRKGSTLWLDGGIDPTLIDEFTIYNAEPIKTLYLNSSGGRVEDAFELSDFIRKNNITTIVRKDALCASACTMLFSAGVKRVAHGSARFMIHSARYIFINKKEVNSCLENTDDLCEQYIKQKKQGLLELTHDMFDLYEANGSTAKLREDYFKLPADKDWVNSGNFVGIADWWLTPIELLDYKFVTKIESTLP